MDDGQTIEEFLASIAAKSEEQDSFEQELLQEEISVTANLHSGGTAPLAEKAGTAPLTDRKVERRKFCTGCGTQLKPGKAFCSLCGAQVRR
jgi:hypothetical protein